MENISVSVIIAAAGSSLRMNGENKQLAKIGEIPVIIRSILAFEKLDEVAEIVISTRETDVFTIKQLCEDYKISKLKTIVAGGKTRQESVFNAFRDVSAETRFVAIHDGARPLVSAEKIRKCIADAKIFGGAVLGVPVKDTIKTVDDGLIIDTPDRSQLYITQTPQIFSKKNYVSGVNFALNNNLDFTDDCQLVEAVGVKVCMTLSDYKNIKITTSEDIFIAEAILKSEEK